MPGAGFLKSAARSLFTGGMDVATRVGRHEYLGSLRGLSEMIPTGRIAGSSGIGTLGGALLKKALPYYAIGKGIDYVVNETRTGEELSGAARFGANVLSFGFKANAARHLARGATGTALHAAGSVVGNPAKFQGAYKWVEGKLDQAALGALKLPFKAAGFAAKSVGKMALGVPYAAVSGVRAAGNLVGSTFFGRYGLVGAGLRGAMFHGPGAMMGRMGMKSAGKAWSGVGSKIGESMARFFENRPSIGSQLEPTLGGFMRSVPGLRALGGTRIAQKTAPTMYGFAALGAGAAVMQSYNRYKQNTSSWSQGAVSPNPSNFGAGISVMRRGPSANYGPALTLMLHQNHSRRMP